MLSLTWKTLLVLFTIPFLGIAIEPVQPNSLCDRFITNEEQKQCAVKLSRDEFDSYASMVCGKMTSDSSFWLCFDEAKNSRFSLENLEKCNGERELTDESRLHCLKNAKLGSTGRTPAAASKKGEYQDFNGKN